MLKLNLLGTPQVIQNERNLTSALAGRPLALLAYLAVTGHSHNRHQIADLLWRDVAEAEARRNLRNALYLLRQVVGDYLLTDRQTISLDRTHPLWVDVAIFAEHLTGDDQRHTPERWQEIFALYQGDFLAGLHINDAPVFENWAAAQRYHFQEQAFQCWSRLAQHYQETQAYIFGLAVTQHMLMLQPWREEAHRQQMLFLAATGQRSAALAQYEQCRRLLAAELAVEPMPTTVALYEQLKLGQPLSALLPTPRNGQRTAAMALTTATHNSQTCPPVRTDLGAMPRTPQFQGRVAELSLLHQWLGAERRRCVAILGMGGQGKTALAAHFVTTLLEPANPSPLTDHTTATPLDYATSQPFDYILWRSLLNAPPFAELLQDWLHGLSDQQSRKAPVALDQQLALLLAQLQRRRCLLVLDNWESVLASPLAAEAAATERHAYSQLLRLLIQGDHQSSLLLTSREQPPEVTHSDAADGAVGCLALSGLDLATGVNLLAHYGLHAAPTTLEPLVRHFSGNPLALKLVIDAVEHLFAGDVAAFLAQESHFFGDIGALLDHQFAQLTPIQRTLLYWLAIEREPITAPMLLANLAQPPAQRHFWEALRALQRRSLVETHGQSLSLQNVILEYITERLLEQMVQAIIELTSPSSQLWRKDATAVQRLINDSPLNQYALMKAHAKEYIRQLQWRLLLAPLAQQLVARWGVAGLAARVQTLLTLLRTTAQHAAAAGDAGSEGDGYIAANLLTLMLHCRVDLRGYDFSHLTLRQAYLCDVALPAVNFAHSHFRDTLFTDPFEVVGALTFSPDGQWLITGSYDGLVRLWHAQEGRLEHILDGDQREIGSLAVSPDGEWLASACGDNQMLLWHLPTATRHLNLMVTINFPHPLAFSPDSAWLALAADETIHLIAVKTGALVGVLGGMTERPQALAFSPTAALLVAGSSDGLLYAWRLDTPLTTPGQPITSWRGHQGRLLALCFTPDGKQLVSGGADQAIHCWAMQPAALGTCQWSASEHGDVVAALALGAEGRLLASGSPDQTIRLWEMSSGRLLATLETPEQRVRALAFSTDGRTLVSSGHNQRIYLWEVVWVPATDAQTTSSATIAAVYPRLRQTIHGYANQVRAVAFLPHQPLLVSGGTDKALHWWQCQTGAWQRAWPGHTGWIQSIAVSPDGALIASADQAQQIYLWDNNPTGAYQILQNRSARGHFFVDLTFSPDGRFLAGGSGTTVTLWRIGERTRPNATSQVVTQGYLTLTTERGSLASLAFHPSGRWLTGVTLTGDFYLWHTVDGQLCQYLPQATAGGTLVAFSVDGEALITAGLDETIRRWPLVISNGGWAHYHQPRILCHQSGRSVALAVNPQGDNLATGAYDGQIYLWDVQSGVRLHCLQGHCGWITKVAYAADGQTLVSAATDGAIRLWRVGDGVCLQTLTVPGPYAGMDIAYTRGLTDTQRASLKTLGAVEGDD